MNEEIEDEIAKILEHIETYPEKNFVLSEKEKLLLFNYIIDLNYEFEKTKQQRDHFHETLNLHYDNFKKYKKENERLNNVLNELEDYIKAHIEVCENRLSTPFCNFEKATKELMIHNNYLDKLKELSKESDKDCTD